MKAPSICPVCAWPVPPRARCCPGCGSDESTGWSRAVDAGYAHTLPDEPVPRPRRRSRYLIALIVSTAIVALLWSIGALRGMWLVVAFAIAVLACCAPLAFGTPDPRPEDDRFEILLARCRLDRELAERLVDGESRRHPGATRAASIQRAIERLDSDRR